MQQRAPLHILAAVANPGLSIADIRITTPLNYLQQQGLITLKIRAIKNINNIDLLQADVLVIQREANALALQLARTAQALRVVLVFELDDLLTEPPMHLTNYLNIQANKYRLNQILQMADLISVSTPRLAARLAIQGRTVITPNYGQPITAAPARHVAVDLQHPLTLVVASSDAMVMGTLLDALVALMENPPCPMSVVVIGAMGSRIKNQLPQARQVGPLSREAFGLFLSGLSNPLGLIPLDTSPFSQCKSAIKFMDYAQCGVAAICSKTPPYSDVIEHGETGWLVNDTSAEWQTAIQTLALNSELRQRFIENAQLHIRQHHKLELNGQAWNELLLRASKLRSDKLKANPRPSRITLAWVKIRYGWLHRVQAPFRALNNRRLEQRRAKLIDNAKKT